MAKHHDWQPDCDLWWDTEERRCALRAQLERQGYDRDSIAARMLIEAGSDRAGWHDTSWGQAS